MTSYYALTVPATRTGEVLTAAPDGGQLDVATAPRSLRLGNQSLGAVLGESDRLRVASLAPRGSVVVERHAVDRCSVVCDDGWAVQYLDGVADLVGPQFAQLRTLAARIDALLDIPEDPDAEAYDKAARAQDKRVGMYLNAATVALCKAGADGSWWAAADAYLDTPDGYTYGTNLIALAARDLIGTTEGWNQAAYDVLTWPWRTAVGALHPDDAPLPRHART